MSARVENPGIEPIHDNLEFPAPEMSLFQLQLHVAL